MAAVLRAAAPARPTYRLAVVRVESERVSIRAQGDLDRAALDDLSRLVASELAAGHVFVRIDLSGVTSIDRECLGALTEAHDGCLASQGLLLLEGLGGDSLREVTAAGLDRRLFLAAAVGPPEWHPRIPELANRVRHAGVVPEQRRPHES